MGSSYFLEENFGNIEENAKEALKNLRCPIHNRKGRVSFNYDNNGVYAQITKYCCLTHAQSMANALENAESFDHIEIKNL